MGSREVFFFFKLGEVTACVCADRSDSVEGGIDARERELLE